MEGNWYLISQDISNKVTTYKNLLSNDKDNQQTAVSKLQAIIDENKLTGNALETFRMQLADYFAVMKLCMEADDIDISDCDTLVGYATESFDGDFISSMYNQAEKDKIHYMHLAALEWAKAAAFCTTVSTFVPGVGIVISIIQNPYTSSAKYYDSMVESCQKDMDFWKAKQNKYNSINAATYSLFVSGTELRRVAKNLLAEMDKHCIDNSYTSSISRMYLSEISVGPAVTMVLNDLFEDGEYYKLEMQNLVDKYPELADIVDTQADILALKKLIEECENSTAKEQMTIELNRLIAKEDSLVNKCVYDYDKDGNITGTKVIDWNKYGKTDKLQFFVDLYEMNHPEDMANMDALLSQIKDNPYYAQDNANIRFITYTSPEPERSIMIEYAGIVQVNTFDENDTQHWDSGSKEVHFDLDGYYYYDSNGVKQHRTPGLDDYGGPYRSFFHEMAHAIDDLYVDDSDAGVKDAWNKASLSYQKDSNGMSLQDYTRKDVENIIKMDISTACYETSNYTMSREDREEILDFIIGADGDISTLSYSQQVVYNKITTYYDSYDASGAFVQGTKISKNDYTGYGNSGQTLETFRDVFEGYIDNKFATDPGHDTANYWYSSKGEETYKQSLEFFAETFSARINYSPYNQYNTSSEFFPQGINRYEEMIVEISK